MECKEEVVLRVNFGRGAEAAPAGPDAPISVWWDHRPGVGDYLAKTNVEGVGVGTISTDSNPASLSQVR